MLEAIRELHSYWAFALEVEVTLHQGKLEVEKETFRLLLFVLNFPGQYTFVWDDVRRLRRMQAGLRTFELRRVLGQVFRTWLAAEGS